MRTAHLLYHSSVLLYYKQQRCYTYIHAAACVLYSARAYYTYGAHALYMGATDYTGVLPASGVLLLLCCDHGMHH